MKAVSELLAKASAVAVVMVLVGLLKNLAAENPLPLIYSPPQTVELMGVGVQLIDEKAAFKFFHEPSTVFIDSRKYSDYARSHVQGAIHLAPEDVERKVQLLDGMISEESRLILYCYGPECDMAEKVALFLAQMGYKQMMIMTAGFPKWEKSGYPVQSVQFKGADDCSPDGSKIKYQSEQHVHVSIRRLCSLTKCQKTS